MYFYIYIYVVHGGMKQILFCLMLHQWCFQLVAFLGITGISALFLDVLSDTVVLFH